jgi:hypothetical protein
VLHQQKQEHGKSDETLIFFSTLIFPPLSPKPEVKKVKHIALAQK